MFGWSLRGLLLLFGLTGVVQAWGQGLSALEVEGLISSSARVFDLPYTIAVVNRDGVPLGVFSKTGSPSLSFANFSQLEPTEDVALALARTAAFFSNSQAPLSSRTVRFISGIHFPPGIERTPNAALYGIENTNRGCLLVPPGDFFPSKSIPRPGRLDGTFPGLGVLTGKAVIRDITMQYPIAVNPGGIPIFRGDTLVGGIGVSGLDGMGEFSQSGPEYAAIRGILESGLPLAPIPIPLPEPGEVFVDGIRLPLVGQTLAERDSILAGVRPIGAPDPVPGVGLPPGSFLQSPLASPRPHVPSGWLVLPKAGVGAPGLTADDVDLIVTNCIEQANRTRAAIRLPPGQPAKMVIAVGDPLGNVIGLYRMVDSTVFSIDVAVTKARNAFYFSSPLRSPLELPGLPIGTAVTARTLSFGSQPFFPAGIDGSGPGPFFFSLYVPDAFNPCTQGMQSPMAGFAQSGIVFFPGSAPLYKDGVLVGGLGVSGDGVEQDDFVTYAGTQGFEPPTEKRADQFHIDGVRMPYFKFPRNPTTGVLPDTSPPGVLSVAVLPGNTSVLVEVVGGRSIDQAATFATLSARIGAPLMPPPVGTSFDSSATNVFQITFPAPLAAGTPIEVSIEPIDVEGISGGIQVLDLTAAKSVGSADYTLDGSVDGNDLLMLLRGFNDPAKSVEMDLNSDGTLDSLDQIIFASQWLGPGEQ
jgi:uncharacterized protein GlcG (DUF336 family)